MVDLLVNETGGERGEFLDQQFAFVARLENVKILSQLLKSIHIR